MGNEAAKKAVADLVTKFRIAETEGKLKKYSEEETKKNFILPLFRALGWDVDGSLIKYRGEDLGKMDCACGAPGAGFSFCGREYE
jgi:hypothetical protein